MEKDDYKMEDFNIGDKILFTREGVNSFGIYWKVVGFHQGMIQVETNEMGYKDKLNIDVKDVEKHLKH